MHEAVALGSAIRSLAFHPIYGWNHKFIFYSPISGLDSPATWENTDGLLCMKYSRKRTEFTKFSNAIYFSLF